MKDKRNSYLKVDGVGLGWWAGSQSITSAAAPEDPTFLIYSVKLNRGSTLQVRPLQEREKGLRFSVNTKLEASELITRNIGSKTRKSSSGE